MEIHIFFDHGKHTFCLDGTVDPEQDPLGCGNLLLHDLPLAGKIYGDMQPLDPLLQWDLVDPFAELCLTLAHGCFPYK